MPRSLLVPFAAAALAVATPVLGQTVPASGRWALCPPVPAPAQSLAPVGEREPGATYVHAGQLRTSGNGITTFSGGVEILRDGRRITGDEMVYDRAKDSVKLTGDVHLYTEGMQLQGSSAELQLEQQSGSLTDTRFYIAPAHGFGRADLVDLITPQFTKLEKVTYSTCPPNHQDWKLEANRLSLNDETNTGEAYNVVLSFKGVPFLYTPYINFPLHGRKSGLLPPVIGTSDTNGTELAVPYYWNIAPNRDATLTPRYIEKRGIQANTEYRYLYEKSHGQFTGEYLPNDKLYGDNRWFVNFDHYSSFGDHWNAYALYNRVSDPSYFDDLSSSQGLTSQSHLERRLDLNYASDRWHFLGRVQGYQTLTGNEPYQRLPQLVLDTAAPIMAGSQQYSWHSELVRFAHETQRPVGTRLDLAPAVAMPLQGAAWFLTPRLGVRYTQYQLDDPAAQERLSRTLPVTSLDSGLYFERDLSIGKRSLVQTLEPRLFYLYVPYKNQNDLPLFDTGLADLNFYQLFRDNRFTGADRVGDANQLSAAITTRFLDSDSGAELASASLGQIYYFRDRLVTLTPDTPPETAPHSPLVGDLSAVVGQGWDANASTVWNPDTHKTEVLTSTIRYRPGENRGVAFSYRERAPVPDQPATLHQTDLAFLWPVGRHWNTLGRWNYDLVTHKDLDTVFGLEYQSCCWSVRLVKRATLNTTTLQLDHSFLITFELKGLTSIGNGLDAELQQNILGLR